MTITNPQVTVPSTPRGGFRLPRHVGTAAAVAALAAASALTFVAIDSDSTPTPDAVNTEMGGSLVERGSITAIDRRAEIGSQVSPGLTEHGSITAIERRAAVDPDAAVDTREEPPSRVATGRSDANDR